MLVDIDLNPGETVVLHNRADGTATIAIDSRAFARAVLQAQSVECSRQIMNAYDEAREAEGMH